MDNKLVYKIAKRGEGKTKWLLEKADEATSQGKEVYLATTNPAEYQRFVEKFFSLYHRICTVHQLTTHSDITNLNSVVLMDEMLNSCFDVMEIKQMAWKCEKMYITLSGTVESDNMNR
jgi:hypothetical protein